MKEYKAIRIRKHCGSLEESLKTMFYAVTWKDVLNHLDIPSDEIICEPYGGGDSRIPDWDQTWVIVGKDNYPKAFADDNIFLLDGAPQKSPAQKSTEERCQGCKYYSTKTKESCLDRENCENCKASCSGEFRAYMNELRWMRDHRTLILLKECNDETKTIGPLHHPKSKEEFENLVGSSASIDMLNDFKLRGYKPNVEDWDGETFVIYKYERGVKTMGDIYDHAIAYSNVPLEILLMF